MYRRKEVVLASEIETWHLPKATMISIIHLKCLTSSKIKRLIKNRSKILHKGISICSLIIWLYLIPISNTWIILSSLINILSIQCPTKDLIKSHFSTNQFIIHPKFPSYRTVKSCRHQPNIISRALWYLFNNHWLQFMHMLNHHLL